MAGTAKPKNYFLNEQHELSRGEARGGGRQNSFPGIDWAQKGQDLEASLSGVRRKIRASIDPLRESHYFMCALPVASVEKASTAKNATGGVKQEPTNFRGSHSKVFKRLGLDLLSVTDDGVALVHAPTYQIEKLTSIAASLGSAGKQEQNRWVCLDSFELIPLPRKVDASWLATIGGDSTETIIELQPMLNRAEIDSVIRTLADYLQRSDREKILGAGKDYSGRQWLRAVLGPQAIRDVATEFQSVQSLHQPLLSKIAATGGSKGGVKGQLGTALSGDWPCVGVLDTGAPEDSSLNEFCRQHYVAANSAGVALGEHGTLVASRVVYGDPDGPEQAQPGCRFLDIAIPRDANHVDDKLVVTALAGAGPAFPDVRVFNLSFGHFTPIGQFSELERRERLAQVRELDNFIFAEDILVVVAAGNTAPGVLPNAAYPNHFLDPHWALSPWPAGFNTLTCGSFVRVPGEGGLVGRAGWPSPFTRVGPGVASCPKPDFAASGGDVSASYQYAPGLGVWCRSSGGLWEDHSGTSYAAPILAREAAFAFQLLRDNLPSGARVFACAVKVFLALTATLPEAPPGLESFFQRSLGFGTASSHFLTAPPADRAIFLWQGVLAAEKEMIRLQLPIPAEWLAKSKSPRIRIVLAWETPVNDAASDVWACRNVHVRLKAHPEGKAIRGSKRRHKHYTIASRVYDLGKDTLTRQELVARGDMWIVEIWYEDLAEYFPEFDFSPQQRVALAAELRDLGDRPTSPQSFLQTLPVTQSMVRLSQPVKLVNPVRIRVR